MLLMDLEPASANVTTHARDGEVFLDAFCVVQFDDVCISLINLFLGPVGHEVPLALLCHRANLGSQGSADQPSRTRSHVCVSP